MMVRTEVPLQPQGRLVDSSVVVMRWARLIGRGATRTNTNFHRCVGYC